MSRSNCCIATNAASLNSQKIFWLHKILCFVLLLLVVLQLYYQLLFDAAVVTKKATIYCLNLCVRVFVSVVQNNEWMNSYRCVRKQRQRQMYYHTLTVFRVDCISFFLWGSLFNNDPSFKGRIYKNYSKELLKSSEVVIFA